MSKSKNFFFITLSAFIIVLTVLGVVGVIVSIGQSSQNRSHDKSITVQGTGEVFAVPDIAEFTFTVREEEKDVTKAQEAASVKIARILDSLDAIGIEEEDIQTQNYSSNPRYEWRDIDRYNSKRVLVAFELSQIVEIKVRDLEKTGEVLAVLGQADVYDMSGPNLAIEDTDALRIEAREIAIEAARDEAQQLARDLGVRLGKMIDFNEGGNDGQFAMASGMKSEKMLFDMDVSLQEYAPAIPVGENEIISHVTITYKIK